MEKIKLVIWDLDETFWNGTLSEEGVEIISSNVELVRELTNRGIMNSIVSKNNYDEAKQKLLSLGVWEYFIFPVIDWIPKGNAIKDIIEKCQLRDTNVLFVDDNHLNLKEATFFNPNINIKTPEFINQILSHESFKGKDDRQHTRLKQYKVLEKKAVVRDNFDDNTKFLEASEIRISYIKGKDVEKNIERVVEILERTNQLNYTKIRSSKEEVVQLLSDSNFESTLISVKDNFGDYGIVGFYSLNKKNDTLKHFSFSCRIINLGVAQFIYAKLNFPKLKVIPEVSEELDNSYPHWIREVSYKKEKDPGTVTHTKAKIFFKGGCDLGQMLFYLKGNNFDIIEETNYVGQNNFPIHQEHTQVLLDSIDLTDENKKYIQENDNIPFTDKRFYDTSIFDFEYDCLIYSVLMDYTQELYVNKINNIILPFGGYSNIWTDNKNHDSIIKTYIVRNINIKKETLEEFGKLFRHIGQISPEAFYQNLNRIRKLIPTHIPIIFINGTEVDSPAKNEKDALRRHKQMNRILDNFISPSNNTYLLDVRNIIKDKNQVTNNIRHYNRGGYQKLAINLLTLLNNVLNEKISTKIGLYKMISILFINSKKSVFKALKKIRQVSITS